MPNRNFILILIANMILGSAMPMLIILGGLAGAWLAPQAWLATAPPTAQVLAGIAVATPISLFMGRFGRRAGFLLGAALVVSGAGLAVLALHLASFGLLVGAHAVMGAALVCVNYFRFAAAETVPEASRASAISLTLASGLVAALIGPQLFTIARDAMAPLPFAGAYLAIAALGVLGAVPVAALRLSPPAISTSRRSLRAGMEYLRGNQPVLAAIGVAGLAQAVMILLMTPTALAMVGCGYATDIAADVIRWHVVAMFAPGFFTGPLIQRFGSRRIAYIGLGLLLLSALTALSGIAVTRFYISLILLGIGWNFGFIGGTYMLQAAVPPEERPLVQGLNDTLIAAAASIAALLSGIFYIGLGWTGLAALAAPILIVGILILLRSRHFRAPVTP